MSRQLIREMKRALAAGTKPHAGIALAALARQSALALLERSVVFGHTRLAVVRLSVAVRAGADVPRAHWAYCGEAADASGDAKLQALWLAAADAASRNAVSGSAAEAQNGLGHGNRFETSEPRSTFGRPGAATSRSTPPFHGDPV